jgi:glycine hydroxymethyltransferase
VATEEPKRTPLYDLHRRLTRRLVSFAGWELPVWYTGISDEHAAVRGAAGLFDIGHMGVFEIAGEHAEGFLNAVTTNDVRALAAGKSHYSYLLAPDGLPLDDIILYRLGVQRFMLVANAANAERVWAWLTAVNEGHGPEVELPGRAILRDLKDPGMGNEQRMALALQGPASAEALCRLRGETLCTSRLAALPAFALIETDVAGIPATISRTGYTGEPVGYELFVPPARAVEVWNLILEAGADLGVKPAGLGARDSTRIEAGLPLYGHELAGPHAITPAGAGYAWAVKLAKGAFIGREGYTAREEARTMQVVRFQLDDTGAPAVRPGDPVASRRGEYAGQVTSCTLVSGRQMGLAYVDRRLAAPGTPLAVVPLRGRDPEAQPNAPARLALGEPVLLSEKATVLPRFWRKDEGGN